MRPSAWVVATAVLLVGCGEHGAGAQAGASAGGGGRVSVGDGGRGLGAGADGAATSGAAGATTRSDAGAAGISTMTSIELGSMSGGTKLPFTVGLGFKKGDVPDEFTLELETAQVEVKRRWNDGSVKHAIVSGHVDLSAGQPKKIRILPGAYAARKPLTCSDIEAAAPRATVSLGALGSVELSALLTAPTRTWLSGSDAVECHYRGKVGTDATLRVQYQVRLYREGRIFVRAIVENGFLDVMTPDKSYVPAVSIDGQLVYDAGGQELTHYAHTRWFAEGWIGGDPRVIPKHDVSALVASMLLPNYDQQPAAPAALDGLYQVYRPYEPGGWTPHMGETGFQEQIGILPNWDALYVTSGGDARALGASIANAKALNSYPLVWRDSADEGVVRPSGRPTWTVNGEHGGGDTTAGAGALVWDNAHHGSGGYLAYLLTGDYLFLETMEMQSSLSYLLVSSSSGAGPARILTGQTRAMAWAHRTVGQYVAIAPLTQTSEDYRALLAANAAHWNGVAHELSQKHLGLVYSYELGTNAYGDGLIAPWQQNFVAQVFGHVSDLEPLANMDDWNAVRDYTYQFPVGLLGMGGSDGYCFTQASQYTLKVADVASDSLASTYASWAAVYAGMFDGAPCGNVLQGSSGGAPDAAATGYYGNLLPAIAYAVDHHAPGAAAAWARFTAASNYDAVKNSEFDKVAVWSVVPR